MPKEGEGETNRLSISARDLEKTVAFLEVLTSLNDSIDEAYRDVVRESLLLSSIICYTRPFSHNEKDEAARADPKVTDEVLADFSKEERALHNKLRCLRNKAIAHSEWQMNPTQLTDGGVFVGNEFSIFSHLTNGEIVVFTKMANTVLENIHKLRAVAARQA